MKDNKTPSLFLSKILKNVWRNEKFKPETQNQQRGALQAFNFTNFWLYRPDSLLKSNISATIKIIKTIIEQNNFRNNLRFGFWDR